MDEHCTMAFSAGLSYWTRQSRSEGTVKPQVRAHVSASRTNFLPYVEFSSQFLSQSELCNSDPTKQFDLQWKRCKDLVVDVQSITIENGDCTDRGVELTAHPPSRSEFSVEQSRALPHLDRCQTEDICIEPIHSRLDSVRFCMVPQQE